MPSRDREDEVYISFGSNIDPEAHVIQAAKALIEQVAVLGVSNLYRSAAKERPEQPPFINGVFRIATTDTPIALKYERLRGIEATLGRVRSADRLAPRTIDLDIVVFGDIVVESADIILPDPDIYRYNHIAVPLCEVGPHLVLPDRQQAVSTLESAMRLDGLRLLPELTEQLKGIIENGRKESQ